MGILDKVMFWKKKDEFADAGLGEKGNLAFGDDFGHVGFPGQNAAPGTDLGSDVGGRGYGSYGQQYPQPQGFSQQRSFPQQPSFSQPYPQPGYNPQQEMESKNLEIISSKLDALRASIESLNQRLANLEAIARGDEESSRRRRYY
ncbi:hypothetical protein HYW19_01225 [Candidatus Woesearchaeota archaeon]|nr:hypothetical protein [Candidatus Woesearchaeota archaeon]